MNIELRVPQLPESVADATLLDWQKQPGERVARDEILVELETDKVVLEVPAPGDGILEKILFQSGETVTAETVLGTIKPVSAVEPKEMPVEEPDSESPLMSPAVRVMIKEQGLEASRIQGSGKHGRILKADVEQYLQQQTQQQTKPVPPPQPVQPSQPNQPLPGAGMQQTETRTEERVPMTRLRQRIAERLLQAQQTAAILTTFNEVNLKEITDLRVKYRESFEKQHSVKLGFMSFFVKASVEALKEFPIVNASVDGKEIVYHSYFDIGIAVSSPRGLVVPILRDADRLNFAEIEKQIKSFSEKALQGTLSYEELTGGTFSISNGGVFGSMLSTPILNPPQSAILGMHSIQQRPVVVEGEIVIRPMMYLALSYDHRIIDGRDAVRFLVSIKQHLEDPTRLLLEV
jgi:2-oxoglutarate dehydrogenase E2 component (dihydrolipoamide succinyltransferase)